MRRTAAVLVIGNELLTGKVVDSNTGFLARELFALGIALRRVVVCPDEIEQIARDANALRAAHDLVFTSGGVGPTHDDVTLEALAAAMGTGLRRHEPLAARIRQHFGARLREAHLRMADVPENTVLIDGPHLPWPILAVGNVYVLPGLPEAFRITVEALRQYLGGDPPFVSRALYTTAEEGDLSALLREVAARLPEVSIGSYPRWNDPDYRVKITFDGSDARSVDEALVLVRDGLPAGSLRRVE